MGKVLTIQLRPLINRLDIRVLMNDYHFRDWALPVRIFLDSSIKLTDTWFGRQQIQCLESWHLRKRQQEDMQVLTFRWQDNLRLRW